MGAVERTTLGVAAGAVADHLMPADSNYMCRAPEVPMHELDIDHVHQGVGPGSSCECRPCVLARALCLASICPDVEAGDIVSDVEKIKSNT